MHDGSVSIVLCYSMRFSIAGVGALLALGFQSVAAGNAIHAFKRVERRQPVIERADPIAGFKNPRLQKRASPYLNNVTESWYYHSLTQTFADYQQSSPSTGLVFPM